MRRVAAFAILALAALVYADEEAGGSAGALATPPLAAGLLGGVDERCDCEHCEYCKATHLLQRCGHVCFRLVYPTGSPNARDTCAALQP